jgi:hypothetical protein
LNQVNPAGLTGSSQQQIGDMRMKWLTLITLLALTSCTKKLPDYRRGDVITINLKTEYYSEYCEDSGKVNGYVGPPGGRYYLIDIRCFRDSYISQELVWVDSELNTQGAF